MTPRQERLPLPESPPPTLIAAVFMIGYEGSTPHILLAEQVQRPEYFTLPGGAVEPKETPIQCALRELREEVGLEVEKDLLIKAFSKTVKFAVTGEEFEAHCFFAFWDEATNESPPKNREPERQEKWQWVPLHKAARLSIEGKFPSVLFEGFWMEEILSEETLSYLENVDPLLLY